ncbi:MBL fold metallo-hydrolase [Neofamilia massiliensis]|uniref:MBL fold metallo-hydrolase n=1 Tax=Neofamilia massiliensis TaxID=1673724 RepID=UPI0006BB891B|nr:MBL fold metallo-hydrolase [Neofamilia massiliensis]
MEFKKLELGFGQMNSYILWDEKTKEGAIIDPGYDFYLIEKALEEENIVPKFILLTHSHGDHIGAIKELKDKYKDLKVYVHKDEEQMIMDPVLNLSRLTQMEPVSVKADETFEDGKVFTLGDIEIKAIHTPGHSPGGTCYLVGNTLFSGDTLFKLSVGRSDFYLGDQDQLINSIKTKLLTLDDDIVVYPGHGPETTIGQERERNPFL